MAEITFDQLTERVAGGRLSDSYFLKAEDPYLTDEATRLLVEAHLEGGAREFDLDEMSGDEVDAETLASRLDTPPLMSAVRVIVVREAQALRGSARTVLEEAVQSSVPARVLIVVARVPRGSKAKLYGLLAKHAMTVNLRSPRASELPGWLVRRTQDVHGVTLEVEAAQQIVSALGDQLGALAQEIEKLVSFVSPRQTIGGDDVRAAVSGLPRVDRWSWIDNVAERKFGVAVAELPDLLDSGESGVGLIISLGESLLRLGLALSGESALTEALKRDGSYYNLRWKVPIYMRQARRWTPDEVRSALLELLRADRLIKSGGLPDRVALQEAVLRMQARSETSRARGVVGKTT